jgi:hypothetical protein
MQLYGSTLGPTRRIVKVGEYGLSPQISTPVKNMKIRAFWRLHKEYPEMSHPTDVAICGP